MGARRLVVYGAGGHGNVVADALLACGEEVAGFLDDGIEAGARVLGLPVLGGGGWVDRAAREGAIAVALGIGSNAIRRKVAARCAEAGASLVTVIHPRAAVSRFATVAEGAVVFATAAVNPGASIGAGAIVNTGVVVEHDVVLEPWSHLSSGVSTGGGVRVGEEAHVGVGAALLPFTAVGARSVVGAGAVVTRDIPPDVVAWGVPARTRRPRP